MEENRNLKMVLCIVIVVCLFLTIFLSVLFLKNNSYKKDINILKTQYDEINEKYKNVSSKLINKDSMESIALVFIDSIEKEILIKSIENIDFYDGKYIIDGKTISFNNNEIKLDLNYYSSGEMIIKNYSITYGKFIIANYSDYEIIYQNGIITIKENL